MELDEFVKLNKPASTSRSRLAPYLADIHRLRKLGYSWVQVQSYLAAKGITVAFQTVAAYVKRHPDQNVESVKPSKPLHTMMSPALTAQQEAERSQLEIKPADHENEREDGQTSDSSFFKPSDLRDIMQSSVDLDKLAKIGKSQKPKRKKPHETGSD